MAIKIAGTEVINDNKRVLNNESLPDVRPSLLLDFANSKTLDPRITFTRGSTATYWDGKTTAKAEENLVRYSQNFNSGWGKVGVTVTVNDATAPDGTTTAAKIEITTTGNYRGDTQTVSASTSTEYTASMYLKAGNHNYAGLQIQSRLNGSYVATIGRNYIDLSDGSQIGSTVGTVTVTDVGNGWYRLTCTTTTASSGLNQITVLLDIADSGGNTAPSTPIASGSNLYAWGAQLEDRTSVTAYTATTSSPIVKYQPVLQTAASGEARFDHDPVTGESKGLLIEEARTNINNTSEQLGAGYNTTTNASALDNYGIAPDGTQTADLLVENTATAFHQIVQAYSGPTSGETWTYSVFVKRGNGSRHFAIRLRDSTGTKSSDDNKAIAYFDLGTGTVSSSTDAGDVTLVGSSIEDAGNGWYRCSISGYVSNMVASYMLNNFMTTSAGSGESYAGDGFSSMLIWGMQMEEGSFPTSYIPTSGSTVTRAVENASITGDNFSSWYRQDEGTLYSEADTYYVDNDDNRILAISDGASLNRIYMRAGLTRQFYVERNDVEYFKPDLGNFIVNTFSKVAGAYALNDAAAVMDGGTVSTASTVIPPLVDRIYIGAYSAGNALFLNGHIKKIAYYPKRLPNATLQAMTEA